MPRLSRDRNTVVISRLVYTGRVFNVRTDRVRLPGGGVWQFGARGGRLEIENSLWVDGAARPHATLMLAITSETPADGMTISWELARAR